jgi:cytochrome c
MWQRGFLMKAARAGLALLASIPAFDAALALSPSEQRGLVFARTNCSQCHSIDPVGPSPLSLAPPFRELHKRYPVEDLEESLAEGIRTGHPGMPEFHLEPDQITDFISFLKSLE